MDEKKEETVEDVKVEETGVVDTQTTEETKTEGSVEETKDVKSEAQKLADAIVAKKLKNMPSKEELKAYKDWHEQQKTEAQKQADKEAELVKTQSEKDQILKENMVFKAGVRNVDDVEFIVYKVSKMDGDFEENLEDFLENNKKYTEQEEKIVESESKTTGMSVKKGSAEKESGVDAILKAKHPELFK